MIKRLIASSLTLVLATTACRPSPITQITTSIPSMTAEATKPAEVLLPPTQTSQPASSTPTARQTPTIMNQSPTPSAIPTIIPASPTSSELSHPSQAIIIDHTSIDLFDQIPEEYLIKARELRMMYADASVGQNINEALDCLTAQNWAASPAHCRNDYIDKDWNWKTFNSSDFEAGRVPARILFSPDPEKYNRSNWIFETLSGEWSEMTKIFIESLAPSYLKSADVLSYQFNYFHVSEFGDIADPDKGFFVDNPQRYDYKDLENFIAQHPDKTFIYWTTSLARSIGTQMSVDFNKQMRQYALDNDLILFDVADIESHTDLGIPCYDSRDGIEYCSRRGGDGSVIKCENEPDDGLQLAAICQDYTTEAEGGHLGSVSGGGIRLAKAFWVLMARIAGWQP
jgi:hypothetical protein